jgi:hypothetical protein
MMICFYEVAIDHLIFTMTYKVGIVIITCILQMENLDLARAHRSEGLGLALQ